MTAHIFGVTGTVAAFQKWLKVPNLEYLCPWNNKARWSSFLA